MRIFVKGFGCSSSLADAEVLAGCLSKAGHELVGTPKNADVLLYNTCAVKGPTEDRMVNLLSKTPKEKRLIVAGCLPLVNLDRLSRNVRFDAVVGPAYGEKIVKVVEQVSLGNHVAEINTMERMPGLDLPHLRINPNISIIPIGYGCLGSCAYCCVRFARGKLRSYGVNEVVEKVEKEVAQGIGEFWLTSQDTASYGRDNCANLASLLRHICDVKGDFRIRVGMMTPNNCLIIQNEFFEAFQDEKVFKFLHLPVQSGDNRVLDGMNRQYSREDFMMIIEDFKNAFPQSTIATDLIVGFPGETEEAFKHTCELIENVKPDIVNISKFRARPSTRAANMAHKIPSSRVKLRSARLSRLTRLVALERNHLWKGWSGKVYVDEIGKPGSVVGRNFAYKPIVLRVDHGQRLLGQFIHVKVIDAFQSHLLGEIS